MTSERATVLLAEFDAQFGNDETDQARDLALQAGTFDVWIEVRDDLRFLCAFFDSGYDAARAAIEMVAALDDTPPPAPAVPEAPATPGQGRRWGMRIALCTSPERGSVPAHATQLLARTGRGQILVTAPTAILIGPTLPRGADLLYHAMWRPARDHRPERIYELCLAEVGGAGDATSNVDWARRAVEAAAADERNIGALLRTWQHSGTGHLRIVLVSGGDAAARFATGAELALRVHAKGALVLYGRWDTADPEDYHGFREALGVYAAGCSVERLRADLDGYGEEIARLLPEVGTRIGVPWEVARGQPGPPWNATGRLAEALGVWLSLISGRRRTLLVLDELQGADPASVQFLTQLWHACGPRPLTVLLTADADRPISPPREAVAGVIEHLRL